MDVELDFWTKGSFGGLNDQRAANGHNKRLKTLLSLGFLFLCMMVNAVSWAVIHDRVPLYIDQPLPDISFDYLPEARWPHDMTEYIMLLQVFAVVCLTFAHRNRCIIVRRFALITGILYLYRAVCIVSIGLPLPEKKVCAPQIVHFNGTSDFASHILTRAFHITVSGGLSVIRKHHFCGDYMFSGHTLILTMGYLILKEYLLPAKCFSPFSRLVYLLPAASLLVGTLGLLVSRSHYLIDILISYYATTRTFWIYHSLLVTRSRGSEQCSRSGVFNVWWMCLFNYFEDWPLKQSLLSVHNDHNDH